MPIQIAGFTSNNIAEVEANSLALRVTPKPIDYGSLGIYSVGFATGTMPAGITANTPIYSFRWGSGTALALLKKLIIGVGNGPTAFAAGIATFNCFKASAFSASDSGGTSITPASGQNKLRTSMGNSLITDLRIATTTTLTAGTRTKDTNPFAQITTSEQAATGLAVLQPTELFRASAGDYPLVLTQNEGFIIEVATIPSTGTWIAGITALWEEVTSYVP